MIKFERRPQFQELSVDELNEFETQLARSLPQDYRQHMLQYNGGGVVNLYEHINFPENDDHGLSYLRPIRYGTSTVESLIEALGDFFQSEGLTSYIPIGYTRGGGYVIMSLRDDDTYGSIQHIFSGSDPVYMSPSFTKYLDDMVEVPDSY